MTTAQEIVEATGHTEAYARMLLRGKRWPSIATALKIFDHTGAQLGPLENLTAEGIEAARLMVPPPRSEPAGRTTADAA